MDMGKLCLKVMAMLVMALLLMVEEVRAEGGNGKKYDVITLEHSKATIRVMLPREVPNFTDHKICKMYSIRYKHLRGNVCALKVQALLRTQVKRLIIFMFDCRNNNILVLITKYGGWIYPKSFPVKSSVDEIEKFIGPFMEMKDNHAFSPKFPCSPPWKCDIQGPLSISLLRRLRTN